MPRNRLLSQIDDELVRAKEALAFWREQTLLSDIPLRDCAHAAVKVHEECLTRLIEIQEVLADM
jgi:hypothetical protein